MLVSAVLLFRNVLQAFIKLKKVNFSNEQSSICTIKPLTLIFLRSYYEANDISAAIEIMEEAFSKHHSLVSMEDVNIAAELYISNKQYDKALAVSKLYECLSLPIQNAEGG